MDIYIYDIDGSGKLKTAGLTDRAISFCWTRRFFSGDSFEAVFPAAEHELSLIKQDRIIEIPGRYSGYITSVTSRADDKGGTVSVSGCSFTGMLKRRVLIYGEYSDSLLTVLDKNAGEGSALSIRKLPGAVFDKSVDCPGKFGSFVKYSSLEKYAGTAGRMSGFGVCSEVAHGAEPYIRFFGRYASDRSAAQGRDSSVIFSEGYDNIRSLEYRYSGSGALTNAVVYTLSEETGGYTIPEFNLCCGDYNGWRSVERAFRTEPKVRYIPHYTDSGVVYEPVLDYEALYDVSREIQENVFTDFTDRISASVAVGSDYRRHFDTGDIVTFDSRKLGLTRSMRITEITERFENGGFTAQALLEEP